jgi:predicted  nucleic acid-binding Zn-ribbon protein
MELLGRMAAGLEEAGRALKTVQSQQLQLQAAVSSLHTKVDSAHSRIKSLEHKVDGNGSKGLKTEVELLKHKLEGSDDGLKKLQTWRESLGDKKIQTLEEETRDARKSRLTTFLTVGALLVAIGSMAANCGPQWVKAWSPKEASKGGP